MLSAIAVLDRVAEFTRRTNGEAIIVYCGDCTKESNLTKLNLLTSKLLADVPYQIITANSNTAESILNIAEENTATTIVLAKNSDFWKQDSDSISQQLLESTIAITLV